MALNRIRYLLTHPTTKTAINRISPTNIPTFLPIEQLLGAQAKNMAETQKPSRLLTCRPQKGLPPTQCDVTLSPSDGIPLPMLHCLTRSPCHAVTITDRSLNSCSRTANRRA